MKVGAKAYMAQRLLCVFSVPQYKDKEAGRRDDVSPTNSY